jgi:hypothetical protein
MYETKEVLKKYFIGKVIRIVLKALCQKSIPHLSQNIK